jgi:transcriptional regulator with XRE-family HTH domain
VSIEARFEETNDSQRRGAQRRILRLGVVGRFRSEGAGNATVRNLSPTGLLIETSAELAEGETFAVDLPEADAQDATVVWADPPHYGCRFAAPLAPAALAAAQLKAEPEPPADDSDQDFAARLRRLRKERGLSLGEIAARLGVSKPTVWAWEHGKSRPVDRRMSALAEVLGITAGGLQPGPSEAPEALDQSRRRIAEAYGVEPARVRIMIEL